MTDQQASRALATVPRGGLAPIEWTQPQIDLLKRTLSASKTVLTNDELALFIAVCKRTALDPFLRQIHAIKDKSGRFIIHVGIDGRRAFAQRTRQVDGTDGPYWCGEDGVWKDVWLQSGPPAAAKFTVFRKGHARGYTGVARWESFKGVSPNWTDRPDHQLAVRAEDHSYRKAFPYEMATLPAFRPDVAEADPDEAMESAAEEYERLQAAGQAVSSPQQQGSPAQEPAEGDYTETTAEGVPEDLKKRFADLVDEIQAHVKGSTAKLPADSEPVSVWQERYDALRESWDASEHNPRKQTAVAGGR